MVLQLTTHMSATGIINRSVTKAKHQTLKNNKAWIKGKTWFRRNLKALADKAKGVDINPLYQANMGVITLSPQQQT